MCLWRPAHAHIDECINVNNPVFPRYEFHKFILHHLQFISIFGGTRSTCIFKYLQIDILMQWGVMHSQCNDFFIANQHKLAIPSLAIVESRSFHWHWGNYPSVIGIGEINKLQQQNTRNRERCEYSLWCTCNVLVRHSLIVHVLSV